MSSFCETMVEETKAAEIVSIMVGGVDQPDRVTVRFSNGDVRTIIPTELLELCCGHTTASEEDLKRQLLKITCERNAVMKERDSASGRVQVLELANRKLTNDLDSVMIMREASIRDLVKEVDGKRQQVLALADAIARVGLGLTGSRNWLVDELQKRIAGLRKFAFWHLFPGRVEAAWEHVDLIEKEVALIERVVGELKSAVKVIVGE